MPQTATRTAPDRSSNALRLLLPIFGGGVLLAIVLITANSMVPAAVQASEVRREVRRIAEQGGYLGPFKIQAEHVDPVTGDLVRFSARAETLLLGASRARIEVDAHENAIALVLSGVVVTRLPAPGQGDTEAQITSIDRFVLGPFPYQRRIVDDGTSRPLPERFEGTLRNLAEMPADGAQR